MPYYFPQGLHHFIAPLTEHKGAISPHPHQHLLFLVVICSHPNGYEVVSYFGFDLNLLYDQRY